MAKVTGPLEKRTLKTLSDRRLEVDMRTRKAEARGLRRPQSLGVYAPRDLDLSTHVAFLSVLNNAQAGFTAINLDVKSLRDTEMDLEKKLSMLDPSSVSFSKFKKALESVERLESELGAIKDDVMTLVDRVDEIDETLEEL